MRQHKNKTHLHLETLEDRLVPAVTWLVSGTDLMIYGTDASNTVTLYESNSQLRIEYRGDQAEIHDDVINSSGINQVYFWGFEGDDYFLNDTALASTAWGHAGNDTFYGGRGNDKLHGEAGDDELYGWYGDDMLSGGEGRDMLYGEAGHDNLYGGGGHDTLRGGDGLDGLFGGGLNDRDDLYGDAGADRFLLNNPTGQTFDTIKDLSAEDAKVLFTNISSGSMDLGKGSFTYAAGAWTDGEIESIDGALGTLHKLVGNTKLLKLRSGNEITFQRTGQARQDTDGDGNTDWNWWGWNGGNGSGTIGFFDDAFAANQAVKTTYHEIGHNWDDASENPFINEFRSLSDWQVSTTAPSTNHRKGEDGRSNWWYSSSAQFARDYGHFNPLEDYATTWETRFSSGNTAVQSKVDNVNKLFAALRANVTQLQEQHSFRYSGDWYVNYYGQQEKWFTDRDGAWFFLTENGTVYRAGNNFANSTAIAILDAGVYSEPLADLVTDTGVGQATLVSPTGTTTDTTPTFRWNAATNASWYNVYIRNNSTGEVITQWVENTTEYTHSSDLAAGSYTFWVQTYGNSQYGDWSEGMSFEIETINPAAATLIGPGGTTTDTTPRFRWNAAANATWYKVYVRNNSTGEVITQWVENTTEYTHSSALAAGDYTFWVQTYGNGEYGDWSSAMNFTIEIAKPATVTLINPGTTDIQPTLRWNAAANATWYYVYLRNNDTGTVETQWVQNDTQYTFDTVTATGSYTFWVQSWGNGQFGDWSEGMNFRIDP